MHYVLSVLHLRELVCCLNSQSCCPIRWGRDGSLENPLCLIPPCPVPGKPIGHWTKQKHPSPCRSSRNRSEISKREYSLIKCLLQCALWWHDYAHIYYICWSSLRVTWKKSLLQSCWPQVALMSRVLTTSLMERASLMETSASVQGAFKLQLKMKTQFLWQVCRSRCLGWEKWSLTLVTPGRGYSLIVKCLAHENRGPVRLRSDEKWYSGVYLLCFEVVICMLKFVPDGFQDRSKGGNPNSCSNQHSHFILENILTDSAKRSIHLDPGRRQKTMGKSEVSPLPATSNVLPEA